MEYIKKNKLITLILLYFFSQAGYTIFVPGYGSVKNYFLLNDNQMVLSLFYYFIGLAVFSPIYGFLSDYLGRKKLMIIGIFLFILGSILCLYSTTPHLFFMSRFVQGAGSGSFFPLASAALGDMIESVEGYSSYIGVCQISLGISAIFLPLIGAYLCFLGGWKCIIFVLTIFSILLFGYVALFFKENKHKERSLVNHEVYFKFNNKGKIFVYILAFLIVIISTQIPSIYLAFIPTLSSKLLKNEYIFIGLSSSFGAFAYIVGSVVNLFLTKRLSIHKILLLSGSILGLTSFSMLILSINFTINIYACIIYFIIYMFIVPILLANGTSIYINTKKNRSGGSSGIVCSLDNLIGALAILYAGIFLKITIVEYVNFLFIVTIAITLLSSLLALTLWKKL